MSGAVPEHLRSSLLPSVGFCGGYSSRFSSGSCGGACSGQFVDWWRAVPLEAESIHRAVFSGKQYCMMEAAAMEDACKALKSKEQEPCA
ncbi:hypothetical protein GUJ93_ZPchr0010g8069 [Zizania palustris]|uniref:Uncharacterized protein n=1 Tax=Zizania palustris TaxID=103762 RepID=A0A8J5WEP5_ZIZPA|nr:hypothetical protein GUJ93_ZPchr0010g8069 [Zizania palustris]